MRDTWILLATAAVMVAMLVTGQSLRGDFTSDPALHAPIQSNLNGLAVEENGIALININKADAETLTRLDGIGKTLSERIVTYREEYGDFTSLDELLEVDGIGAKTLQRIRSRLICLP